MFNKISSLFSSASKADEGSDTRDDSGPTSESCTQSSKLESMKPRTLDQMLRYRAQLTPDANLLWYPSSATNYVPHTAARINAYVDKAAATYARQIPQRTSSKDKPTTVALLGPADMSYIITMFAIYRLGHTVVAHSPRLAREAHEHLLGELDTHHIIYHQSLSKMAKALDDAHSNVQIHTLIEEDIFASETDTYRNTQLDNTDFDMDVEGKNLAVVIHSSGSTGLPKPTRLSHDTLIMAANKNVNMKAFSCVPFFHAFGLNGLHRGIYAAQDFYFYNASLPLTSQHLINTIINRSSEIFFCVPYALKLLAETENGVEALKRCKLVWFAGSACPDDLGDALTEKGIRLISDYGLSECGPLMTTMRPEEDHAWNYLRPLPHNKPYMKFEKRGDNMFELVCLDGMPWKVAENREDHSYATKDLFQKHPTMKDAYRFITRQDDTLVLSNGEKANPTILEGKVRQHNLIAEAIVFGSGKTELGILLVKSEAAENIPDDQILEKVWPTVKEAQKEMPEHARIVKSMVVILPAGTSYPKTDKGTIIRQQVYKKFDQEIEDAYTEESTGEQVKMEGSKLEEFIRNEVKNALNLDEDEHLDVTTDLFSLGVDSLQSSQLRRKIQSHIDLNGNKLPINFVYENPTIQQLSSFIYKMTSGNSDEAQSSNTQETFEALLEKHGSFETEDTDCDKQQQYVLLTGSTGSLGAHLLYELLQDETVVEVYCLVRASSSHAALQRITQSLQARKVLNGLNEMQRAKITALPSDLAAKDLGLEVATYQEIALNTTTVIHAAWPVNFNMSLASFQSDVVGTRNLLDLCLSPSRKTRASFTFCSSISTSMNVPAQQTIPESVPSDLSPTLEMGYAQSKLAAEHLCIRAAEQTGLKSYVMRIGQIVGDTQHGVWNATEALPMMIQTAQTIGALPKIEEVHKWLPVDVVAMSILEMSLPAQAPGGTVFNIVNPSKFTWGSDLLPKLRNAGLDFQETTTEEWLEKLRSSDQDGEVNPPIKLLSYFESVYGNSDAAGRGEEHFWEVANSSRYSSTFAKGWKLSEHAVQEYIGYWQGDCWNKDRGMHKYRQASWSSDATLGDDDASDEVRDEKNEHSSGADDTKKKSALEEMYTNLGHKARMDSIVTLKDEEGDTADKVFWNPEEKRFDLRGIETPLFDPTKSSEDGAEACYVKIDMSALKSGKVLAWTGTQFELRDPEESSNRSDDLKGIPNENPEDSAPSGEPVVVPSAGELVWDGTLNRFEVGFYGSESKTAQNQKESGNHAIPNIDTVSQPRTVVWDGTKFACN